MASIEVSILRDGGFPAGETVCSRVISHAADLELFASAAKFTTIT